MGEITLYERNPTEASPSGDSAWIKKDWLEETHRRLDSRTREKILAENPFAFLDQDTDGYLEVSSAFWEKFSVKFPEKKFPLATYFEEPQECNKEKTEQEKRLSELPGPLGEATRRHNFKRARQFFAKQAGKSVNPLKELRSLLSKHLNASAIHMGGNLDESVRLRDRRGFSVRFDGRFRFDCVIFAELARSDFRDVSGIKATYVLLDSAPSAEPDHVILVLSDQYSRGRYILVSDESVTYLESGNIWEEVKKRFPGYAGFYRASSVTALDEMEHPF